MTAIKKTTAKSTKSPAPATEKPAAKKKATVALTPVLTPAVKITPAAKVATAAAKPVVTAITAKIDVGFGNTLFVRGEGPGLSWERGIPLACVGDDTWAITLGESSRPYVFKFLINDTTWSIGPDFTVEAGKTVTFSPGF